MPNSEKGSAGGDRGAVEACANARKHSNLEGEVVVTGADLHNLLASHAALQAERDELAGKLAANPACKNGHRMCDWVPCSNCLDKRTLPLVRMGVVYHVLSDGSEVLCAAYCVACRALEAVVAERVAEAMKGRT